LQWGVLVCQEFFGKGERVKGERSVHVGDQFLSAGSNDFKARVVGTTAWIASPGETVELLDELRVLIEGTGKGEGEERDLGSRVDELFEKPKS
jgi:IMP and pyridine-specific 5'-nucleotidase